MNRWMMAIPLLLSLGACAADAQTALPDEVLGTWYYMGSSGGISGDGMGDEPTGYIVIHEDNTIEHFRDDGTLIGVTDFEAALGETIFSTEPLWILRGGPIAEVLMISDDGQHMSLSENVYDGFSRGYARSR